METRELRGARRRASVLAAVQDVVGLVVPVCCAGCGEADVAWCGRCAEALQVVARREADVPRLDRMDGAPVLPVWTAAAYAGPVRTAIPAWKDGGRADLTRVMVDAVRSAAEVVARELGPVRPVVVSVPTGRAARRRRGADLVGLLADGVAAELGARRERGLLARRVGGDQVGRGARARGGVAAEYRLRRAVTPGAVHLLVDDVVTTGATLAACTDALTAGGALVIGAIALAATPSITPVALLPGRSGI
ncbi:ComF family protein [Actinotalea sp. M2MS4P-6]|uniref:ComF family protein n=1 Tax=Actinotalea sp. M2MS4P-6 TaxID=2983762 RepID=UPI0021E44EFC|nr:ComF family protein [Actinotalea sp. M2MS4P-6]MCV2394143.1 ComF family protein [Actinotalea sp. M2MS4P-6]